MSMIGRIIHGGSTTPQQQVQTQGNGAEESGATIDINDKFESGSHSIGGTIAGIGNGLKTAAFEGVKGSFNAAYDGMKVRENADPRINVIEEGFISAGGVSAAAVGLVVAGPIGAAFGLMAGPGATGALVEGARGAVDGAKDGFKLANKLAEKAESKISDKIGEENHSTFAKIASKAGKVATYTAAAAVAAPLCAFANGISDTIDYTTRLVGLEAGKTYKDKEIVGVLGKFSALSVGLAGGINAAWEVGAGFVGSMGAGAVASGAVASTIAGVREGVKGFEEGFEKGRDWYENRGNQSKTA